MKLYYFDIAGRAETTRLLFTIGGVKFEDVRFTSEQWKGEFKAKSPTGQAPFLELDDGSLMVQSIATSTLAAELGGLRPSTAIAKARELELMGTVEEAMQPIAATFAIADAEEKLAKRRELAAPGGAFHSKVKLADALVAASAKDGFFADLAKPGLADVGVFCMVAQFSLGIMDGIEADFMNQFPNLTALRDKVAAFEGVKEYYASRTGVHDAYKPK